MSKFLDEKGLEILWNLIQKETSKMTTVKTTNEWLNNSDYIPAKGETIVYSDYKKIVENGIEKEIPSIKIGDGIHTVNQLMFTSKIADKLSHALTIGDKIYDGSEDVTIPIYDGNIV